jgi:hypothetical protein
MNDRQRSWIHLRCAVAPTLLWGKACVCVFGRAMPYCVVTTVEWSWRAFGGNPHVWDIDRADDSEQPHVRSAGKLVWKSGRFGGGVSESCSASVHRSAFCTADGSVAVAANEPSCEITRATASSLPFSALVTTRSRLSAPSKEFLPNYQLYIPVDRCTSSTLKWYISFFLKFIFLNLIIFI